MSIERTMEAVPEVPARGGRGQESVWVEHLRPLMKHEGESFLIATGKRQEIGSLAWNLRKKPQWRPPGLWEFAARKIDDETGGLYATYFGPETPDEIDPMARETGEQD